MRQVMPPRFSVKQSGQSWRFRDDLCPKKRPQRKPAGRRAVTSRERPRTLDWNGTFLKLPETEVNLIFLDRGCLDKDTNTNEAIAVSRITQNDQIGLLEPG